MANLLKELEIVEGDQSYLIGVYDEGANAKIGEVSSLKTEAKNNTVSAINELYDSIIATAENLETSIENVSNKVGTLSELNTSDKTNTVSAINEVNTGLSNLAELIANVGYVTPEDYGAVGDGVTDDSNAINQAIASKKPVKFLHDYAVGSPIVVGPTDSPFIDGQGFKLLALSGMNDYILKVNKLYGVIKNITLNGNLLTALKGGMLVYSTNAYQAQFILFDNIYILNCVVGVQYGNGTTNAQSENTLHGYRTRSVIVPLDINQPNGMLWVTDSHLDATPYEWVSSGITPPSSVTPYVVNQHIGGVAFDNCTLESPSYSNRSMILYDAIVTNCIIEIAGINVQIINYGTSFSSELTFENCRFYESQGSEFITVGGINTDCKLTLNNCLIYGSTGLLIYSTIKLDVVLNNVKSSKSLGGANINLLDVNNVYLGGSTGYHALVKKQFAGAKFIKGTGEYLGTIKVTHDATASVVLTYCLGGNAGSSETIATFEGAGVDYITFDKYSAFEVLNIGTTNGTIETTLFTVDDGQGFMSASEPANAYYPDGSLVVDSTGTTGGWVVGNGHVVPLERTAVI